MIYQARTEANEMFIAMYETEEPKRNQWGPIEPNWGYIKAHEIWQSSKREYKVRPPFDDAIRVLLFKQLPWNTTTKELQKEFLEALQKGIDCTLLKDRLKLITVWEHNTDRNVPTKEDLIEYWTLLPLEDKKENEAVEFAEWVNHYYGQHPGSFKTIKELYQIFKNPNK